MKFYNNLKQETITDIIDNSSELRQERKTKGTDWDLNRQMLEIHG